MEQLEQIANGAVLLSVNQRLARFHLARYQQWQLQQGRLCWETPGILPIRAWLKAMHADALAVAASQRTILPTLLEHQAWQRSVELDAGLNLLDTDAAARTARQAWQLSCAFHCYNNADEYLSLDQFTWQRWSVRYQAYLNEQGLVDEAGLADHMAEVFATDTGRELLPDCLLLDGFLQLPPQLRALVETLEALGVRVEKGERMTTATVHKLQYADDDQELLNIAQQMRCELERDANQALGLVVPDLQKRRAAVLRAFDRVFFPAMSPDEVKTTGRPYDVSLGLPLSDTGVVKCALSLIKLCVSSIEGSEISAVLLSPYLKAADNEARNREQMDRKLRDKRVRSLDLQGLLDSLYPRSQLSAPIKRLLRQRTLRAASLSTWAMRFSDWLKLLAWPGTSVDSEEYQAVSAWMECLDDLEMLDDERSVSAKDALGQLRRLAGERVFQLDTPYTPIQIMGRLESHGIGFDCLWVAGMDTEQWPPAGTPSPFLSIDKQKAQGVPNASASSRLALAEQEFLLWASQAPLLIASRAQTRDGKTLDAAAVPTIPQTAEPTVELQERIQRLTQIPPYADPMSTIQDALSLEAIEDDYGPGLVAGSEVGGGARLFENQALCPFRAFALHRLKIRPLEEAGLGLDPRQHGTLLHRALELFWGEVKNHDTMHALFVDESIEKVVSVCINSAIEELEVPHRLRALEEIRLQALLIEWLKTCELPRQAFEVISLEQKAQIEHGGIVMNVILDRMDRIGDSLAVVDYKTGTSNKVNTWADERIVNPQLPLYVLTNEDIEAVSFAQVARNQCAFKGVASDDALIPKVKTTVSKSRSGQASSRELNDWQDWRAHWRESLDNIAAELRQGKATITPMKTACMYCELKPMCRIDEAALTDSDKERSATYSVTGEAS